MTTCMRALLIWLAPTHTHTHTHTQNIQVTWLRDDSSDDVEVQITRRTIADEMAVDFQLHTTGGSRRLLTYLTRLTKWIHTVHAKLAEHHSRLYILLLLCIFDCSRRRLLSEYSLYLSDYSNKLASIYVPIDGSSPRVCDKHLH